VVVVMQVIPNSVFGVSSRTDVHLWPGHAEKEPAASQCGPELPGLEVDEKELQEKRVDDQVVPA